MIFCTRFTLIALDMVLQDPEIQFLMVSAKYVLHETV